MFLDPTNFKTIVPETTKISLKYSPSPPYRLPIQYSEDLGWKPARIVGTPEGHRNDPVMTTEIPTASFFYSWRLDVFSSKLSAIE